MLAGSVEFDARKLTAVGERLGLRMAILFGSRATGSPPQAPESDLDLAVAFSSGDRASWWDAHRELSAVFPAHVVDDRTHAGAD
jgi:predicted nucleotidyltransferase